ncbi:HEPN domain-containing protein [Pseudodesulfovibrio indicus]|uniref:HEPN domain-containing protein n=2 Tax=Pseudodesulfovibrio indicus TaxID=1716143 RepID=A0AA94THY8_9BACT|nr:HEPN domain-containing protein [Pseudodesulfovibrio indicus]
MNVEDVKKMMTEIDWELQQEKVPVTAREIKAFMKFSQKTGLQIPLTGDHWITKTISEWYRSVYGEKLKVDFSPGSGVVALGHEPYLVKFPRIYGRVQVNPLEWIQGATPIILNSIPEESLTPFVQTLMMQYNDYIAAELLPVKCTDDLASAVNHMVAQRRNYGLSEWASQQSLEKTFKNFITEKGGTFKFTHDLAKLHRKCVELGLPEIQKDIVDQVECAASARYIDDGENDEYTLETAVNSFVASLHCVGRVARSLLNLPAPRIQITRHHTFDPNKDNT